MIDSLNKNDKLVVFSLLTQVMDADEVRLPEEIALWENIKKRFELSQEDVEKANSLSKEKCKRLLLKFSDEQRQAIQQLLIEMACSDGDFAKQEKDLIDSLNLDISHYELELIADWRDEERVIVGFYNKLKNGRLGFNDICTQGFSERTYLNGDEIEIYTDRIPTLEENTYYQFRWTVEQDDSDRGFHIVPKGNDYTKVKPKELVNRLYSIWENSDSDVIKQLSDVQRMVNTQLTASSDGTFIYELLQNANDYPVKINDKPVLVDVEFYLTDNYLIYRHTGREFSPRNIAAISKMSAGEKKKEKNAIGYKGIGFKTVFSENEYVYLRTGEYSLRFDESITQESRNFPWQIMPIWTEQNEVSKEIIAIMSNNRNFRVQMAIRPHEQSKLQKDDKSYEFIFNDIFKDEKDILFIPNIKSVKVFYNGEEQICRTKDVTKWALTTEPLVYTFSQDEIEENNREIKTNKRIPEKYLDFEDTRFSFACQRNGNKLVPVDDARIYCYLPTQVTLGFPFLMNTDMIPTGPRDDIEKKVKFNHKIMKIAGGKFVEWISSLIKCGEYDISSVFSILPSLDNKVENYEDFIDEFGEGFDEALETIKLIPTNEGDFELISDLVNDKTGLSSSGIMSDEEFLKFTGLEDYYLPHSELRKCRKFKSFLNRYADDEQIFDEELFADLIANEDFQEWLEIQDNNNKFLKFLLENNYLENLLDEKIFLEDEGGLFKAGNLYYNIDEFLADLQAFTNHICFLSPATRKFFKYNDNWAEVIDGAFDTFDCDNFVDNVLLSKDNKITTIEKLKDKDTSIHFYKFLSENVGFSNDYLTLPFFNDNDDVVDDFNDKFIFTSSKYGYDICEKEWLNEVAIEFLSPDYDSKTAEYFKENFEVQDFSDKFLVENVILNDDYQGNISEAINNNIEISKDFLYYCYSQKELFKPKSLSDLSLKVFDGNGNEQWYIADGDVFFPSSVFDYYSKKTWIDASWMVVLDDSYFNDVTNPSELKKFIADSFGVEELADKNFYENIVKQHLDDIYKNISGQNDADGTKNVDFVRYLDDNYQLIFEQKKDYDKFDELILVSSGTSNVDKSEEHLYIFDSELNDIISNSWFPDDLVTLCHPDYGQSKSLQRIGVKSYSFKDFYDDVIIDGLDSINEHIASKEDSIAFHNFIIAHLSQLTDEQKAKMQCAKVYLYGQDDPVDSASGHSILSSSAKELLNLGLVEFSDLDILDPDYEPEKHSEYWGTRLENTKFTTSHFMNWLKDNLDTFASTIGDEDLNIAFWRWLKDNVSERLIEETASLPVLLKDGSIDNEGPVYFSDEYMDGAGIEHSVKIFDEEAKFLSPDYISDGDDMKEWRTFFSKANIKYEIVDILVETVIPQLSEIDDENLPKLIADNREALEKRFEDGLISHITDLRVKANNGFYDISETIYIDCEKDEPFPYIILPNQISFGTAEERRLIKDIIDEIEGDCVETLSEWQQRKLDCYLDMQNKDSNSVRDLHYHFINDLSIIRNNSRETLKELEHIKDIQLLNKDDDFCDATALTMGSIYNPFFDFEACGVDTLDYVSDKYNQECTEYAGRIFRDLDVHCDFQKEDIGLLVDRKCALYFWGTYLLKKDAAITRITQLISDRLFDDIACIPTTDYMKRASELYYGADVSNYIKNIEDGGNKVPLTDLPDVKLSDGTTLFSKLQFKNSLDFLDALYALINVAGQDKRTQLLRWMIESYDEKYDDVISKYREDENALWYNNRNELKQIKELYALNYADKALEQYFGANPRIINKAYFPGGESFREACDILGITTITSDDLTMEPIGDMVFTSRDNTHKLYALVIAGMTDSDKWEELFDDYCQKLDELVLHRCKSIMITYAKNNEINQSLKKFYHKQGDNNFYFVNDLDNKRVFKSFVEEFITFLCIDTDDIAEDVIEDIMDSPQNAIEIIKEQNHLMLIEEFKDELEKLRPGIKQMLTGIKAAEDDEDETLYRRPSFTTHENPKSDLDDDGDSYDSDRYEDDDEDENEDEVYGYPQSPSNYGSSQPSISQEKPYSSSHDDTRTGNQNTAYQPQAFSGKTQPNQEKPQDNEQDDYAYVPDPDNGDYMGNVKNDEDYEPLGVRPKTRKTIRRTHPKQFTKDEIKRLSSSGTPLELESLPATDEEINILEQCNISAEQIADTNYLAQLRLYANLKERGDEPEESMEDFVRNAGDVATHRLKGGKWIHTCSAARGVMYISPTIWNMLLDNKCTVCVYLDGRGKNFHYINTREEFLQLVKKDDVVIKITGEEKVDVVNALYSGILRGVKGTAYTLVRVASRTNMDAVFAHYVGDMAEDEDGNDTNEYGS